MESKAAGEDENHLQRFDRGFEMQVKYLCKSL